MANYGQTRKYASEKNAEHSTQLDGFHFYIFSTSWHHICKMIFLFTREHKHTQSRVESS